MVDQSVLLADNSRHGVDWCAARASLVDRWLNEIFDRAFTDVDRAGIALVAVGGYGRAELAPMSDIDVMLVHRKRRDVGEIAERIWYPVWDEGLHLGHSVCTVREAIEIASDVLDTATALLSARHLAGDPSLTDELAAAGRAHWQRNAKRHLTELGILVEARHEAAGEVAFRLEPDLKEGRGGLRDVHALWWARAADPSLVDLPPDAMADGYGVLLDARVELQRLTESPRNVLSLQDQDAVALALGDVDADALMHRIAEAARRIAWTSDETWRRIRTTVRGPLGRLQRRERQLDQHLVLRDGEMRITLDAPIADPAFGLRAAAVAAEQHAVLDRESIERLASEMAAPRDPWPADVLETFTRLLAAGRPAIAVIEALDHWHVWERVVPEWSVIRARPQRNPYHRFTVDRHLLEAVVNANAIAERVSRPDLLILATLLHDIGKGREGDHTEVGVELTRTMTRRMGLAADDAATVVFLVQHHLLLADVAMRRDLDDPTTIERVANDVGTQERLELLAALTEADSLATGPAAWGRTKAQLVEELVKRARAAVSGVAPPEHVATRQFPTADQLALLEGGGRHLLVSHEVLAVVTDDRPGLFSRVAGVLALHGLDVVSASAHSTDTGRALSEFTVSDPRRPEIPWSRVLSDLELALDGKLALRARLAERARTYGRSRATTSLSGHVTVRFDDHASADATVIDVQAPDAIGLLYRITHTLAELDLDIRSARVQTLGHHVLDAFYVRDRNGNKISDRHLRGEIERALAHSVSD